MPGNTDLGPFGAQTDESAADAPGAADAPNAPGAADAPGDGRVCIVATQRETFQRCRDGFYPCPRSYPRSREPFDWMAFYRTAPVSAVTHFAPVTERSVEDAADAPAPDDGDAVCASDSDEPVDETGDDSAPAPVMDADDWAALIEPFSEERRVTVFHLGELRPLSTPVVDDQNGVRGARYTTVDALRAASDLSELAARADQTP